MEKSKILIVNKCGRVDYSKGIVRQDNQKEEEPLLPTGIIPKRSVSKRTPPKEEQEPLPLTSFINY